MRSLSDPNEGLSIKKVVLGLAFGAFTLGAVAACDAPDDGGAPGGEPMDQGGDAPPPPS